MNRNELLNNTTEINDLNVAPDQQAEICGGPKKIFIGGLSAKDSATGLADLEPQGDVVGGLIGLLLPAVQKVR